MTAFPLKDSERVALCVLCACVYLCTWASWWRRLSQCVVVEVVVVVCVGGCCGCGRGDGGGGGLTGVITNTHVSCTSRTRKRGSHRPVRVVRVGAEATEVKFVGWSVGSPFSFPAVK